MIDVRYKFADGTLLLGIESRRRYPTHTLPPIFSPENLFSPGRGYLRHGGLVRVDTRCKVQDCGLPSNLGHLLNGCKKSLDRFEFRHDSVLAYLVDKIMANKPVNMEVYADLNGWRVNGGTVPSDLVATGQIPDIVLLDRVKKTIVLLELTCPFDSSASSFKAALDRKTIRYCRLALDCESLGYTVHWISIVSKMESKQKPLLNRPSLSL